MEKLHPITSCYICNSSISLKKYIGKNLPSRTRIYQCDECSHVSITPFPSDSFLSQLYALKSELVFGPDFVESNSDQQENAEINQVNPKTWISKLLQFYPAGDLLDFGCADGKLVDSLIGRGWPAVGVDVAGFRKDRNFYTTLNEVVNPKKFQYIVLQDTLEHLTDPREVVNQLSRRTVGDGKWFISIPISSSLEYKILGHRWSMVEPYGHLHFFSCKSISKLLSEAGFEIVSMRKRRKPTVWKREMINLIRALISIPYSLIRFKGSEHLRARLFLLINSLLFILSRGDQVDICCQYSPKRISLQDR